MCGDAGSLRLLYVYFRLSFSSANVHIGCGAHSPCHPKDTEILGSVPGIKLPESEVDHLPHLVPRLKWVEQYLLSPFMVSIGTAFPLITYSRVQGPSWEANWFAGSLPHSQASATCPYPGPAQSRPHTHIPPPGDPSFPYTLINVLTYSDDCRVTLGSLLLRIRLESLLWDCELWCGFGPIPPCDKFQAGFWCHRISC